MLAASDPQLFIPFGRKQIERHVGSSTLPLAHLSYSSSHFEEDYELPNATESEVGDETRCNESWILRENSCKIEEELYVKGKVVLWSRGNFGISLANFGEEQPGGRTLVRCYTSKHNVKQALWCSFPRGGLKFQPKRSSDDVSCAEAVCVSDEKQLSIYMSGSEEYFTRLPFKISSVWDTSFGLFIERFSSTSSKVNSTFSQFSNFEIVPTLFTLTHPLNEISPFLILKQGGILSFMREPFMKVVFVFKDPAICVMYDCRTGLHSVWKIRRVTDEERQMMNVNNDTDIGYNNTAKHFTSSLCTNNSVPFNLNNRSITNANISAFSSPFGGSKANSQFGINPLNSSFNKLQSPLPTAMAHSGNFSSSPNVSTKNIKLNQIMSPRFSSSPKHSPSVEARLGNSQCVAQNHTPMPVQPELCLEYLWVENSGNSRETDFGAASVVFISCDFIGQKHLCYLIPSQSQLLCAKLDKTNESRPEIILGSTTVIPAKDASTLPGINLTVVLDPGGQVLLYSGVSLVGQILFGSVSSSQYLTSSYCAPQNLNSATSPKPSRSSLLSSTRLGEEFFDEQFQQISPVKKHIFDDRLNITDSNATTGAHVVPSAIKDSIDGQATLKYSDGTYYRVNFPTLSTSFLVKEILKTFKVILPRDVALNFMITWYRSRNAPGTQDISSEQEWRLFLEIFLRSLGYNINTVLLIQNLNSSTNEIPVYAKKKKESNLGNDSDWTYVLESAYHRENIVGLSSLLNLKKCDFTATKYQDVPHEISTSALLYPHFHLIFFSLHLMYEEFKLNTMRYDSLITLVQLLNQLAADLNLECFLNFYWRYHPQILPRPQIIDSKMTKPQIKEYFSEYLENPPDIFERAFAIMRKEPVFPYPFIADVNNTSYDILQLFSVIYKEDIKNSAIIKPINLTACRNTFREDLVSCYLSFSSDYKPIERIISIMIKAGLHQDRLQNLPIGLAWPLLDIIHRCRESPREDWSTDEYDLLVRGDLSSQANETSNISKQIPKSVSVSSLCNDVKTTEAFDGMEDMDDELMKLIWPKDRRIHQVRGMLGSSTPAVVDIQHRPDVTAHEFIEEQEKHLFGICTRTMALPIGRGMFTLHTVTPSIIEPLSIPKLCLVGKSASTGTSIDFSHIEVVANMNLWPSFHNGVAAGLRISLNASVDSTWILFNKPKSNSEMLPEHAGFLMALGLNGHLKHLKRMNMYEYLSKHHEMTNVALLIGLSATFRGTMDTATTKLLSLHIECLLPPTSLELDIDQNTQIAALLGIGLVYQKSAHRHISEILLSEMGRPPGPEMENCVDRESYTLAAGLALGLVLLERGSDLSGLTDLGIADTLHYYMVGGHKRPLSGPQKEKYKTPSYQIREGDIVNVDVTSPGATLALGLMFFNTGNRAVADWMKAPDTQYILDIICPDFILLRTLARGLILFDDIIPTKEWVESHIPESIRPFCLVKPKPDSVPVGVDLETMNQAYCNIVAGACFAIGLRFAGSANNAAFETVQNFCKIFIKLFGKSISELPGKSTIENCLNVTLISLALIMAGTGNIEVLRICRCLRSRICQASSNVVTYGSHLATHMALGLLFLGGGRYCLSTSPESIAALIIAFYPKFPTHSNDNRYHLQAFRHLYVLAVESRLLMPRDIDSEFPVYANVNMKFIDTKYYKNQEVKLMAPCLLPELKYLKQIEIKDDRYWPIVFKRGKNWNQLEQILKNSLYVDIKQRSGFLPYKEDINGCCILAASSCTTDDCLPWSADIEGMRKYTTDPCILKILECFFNHRINIVVSHNEIKFNSFFKRIVHECITQDKLYFLAFWISIMKVILKMRLFPNAYYSWQIKLFCQSVLHSSFPTDIPSAARPLTSLELGVAIKHYLYKLLEVYEEKFEIRLQECFEESKNNFSIEQVKSTMLSVYDVPMSFQLKSPLQTTNPVEIHECLKNLLSTQALKKLCDCEKK